MSYVNSVLQPGERIVMRGHLHWIVYWHAILFSRARRGAVRVGIGRRMGVADLVRRDRVRRAVRRVVLSRLVHPLDHRDRGDRPAHHLQARLHHPAHESR